MNAFLQMLREVVLNPLIWLPVLATFLLLIVFPATMIVLLVASVVSWREPGRWWITLFAIAVGSLLIGMVFALAEAITST